MSGTLTAYLHVLRQIALEYGAAVAGIADLGRFAAPPGRAIVAIVFGLRYPDEVVDALPGEADIWQSMARSLSAQAVGVYALLADHLQGLFPGSRSCRMDQAPEVMGARFDGLSQKAVAVLAGLGWIGKSSLLVSPVAGPRVRLGVLLTDAPLTPDAPFAANHCRDCRACQEACPVQAITGAPATARGFTTYPIDTQRCLDHLNREMPHTGRRHHCGLCLKVCPFGTRSGRRRG